MFRTLVLWINCIFLSFTLLTIDAPSAFASTGATFTVNPDQRVSVLILDNDARVTMDANANIFTVISPYGQTYTFSFVQIAQELAGTPSEQQALIQQWQTALNDLSNRFTVTNSHEPTLSVLPGSWNPPPGYFEIQGAPEIGDGTDLSTLGSIESPGTGLGILSSGSDPGPCSFAPCSCQNGECHPSHGFPWGMGMVYFAIDAGGGSGKATKERQTCLATHYNNWRMQQQANCASVSSNGLTFFGALGASVVACSATPATWGAAAKGCAAAMGMMGITGTNFINSHRACRANYPGAGSAC